MKRSISMRIGDRKPFRLTGGWACARLSRRFHPSALLLALVSILATTVPPGLPTLEAKVLRHRATGFKVTAPAGFKLRSVRGIYKITKGDASATLMRVHSPLNARSTASSFTKEVRMKRSRIVRQGKSILVSGLVRKKAILVEFKPAGQYIDVSKFDPGRRSRSVRRTPKLTPLVTLADVAILRAIANSRRGGIVTPLQVTVPMRAFAQGGASALVPNIPGWQFSGANGAISGSRLDQGGFALGIPFILGGYVHSGNCVINFFGVSLPGAVVTGLAQVPGSQGTLGPNFESAFYNLRFTYQGRTYDALILSGCTVPGSPQPFWYSSYVAVVVGGPSGIGPALLDTWRTWDATGAINARLNATLQTILTTTIPGSPIDPKVFEEANEAWSEYIRG